MFREFLFRVPFPTVRHTGAVPLAGHGPADHYVRDTFRSQFPFQFCKNKNDLQDGFTYGRRSVELFIQGNERDAIFLEFVIHQREVNKISGYAVNLIDYDVGYFPGADPLHHTQEGGAVSILPGLPGVFE